MKKAMMIMMVIMVAVIAHAITQSKMDIGGETSVNFSFTLPDNNAQSQKIFVRYPNYANLSSFNLQFNFSPLHRGEGNYLYNFQPSTFYGVLTDGTQANEEGLNGSTPLNQSSISITGWQNIALSSLGVYNSSFVHKGNLSIQICGRPGVQEEAAINYANSTFTGTIQAWIYDDGSDMQFSFRSDRPANTDRRISIRASPNNNSYWIRYDTSWINSSVSRMTGWNKWRIVQQKQYTNFYVNDSFVHSLSVGGTDGIKPIQFVMEDSGDGCVYIDEISVHNDRVIEYPKNLSISSGEVGLPLVDYKGSRFNNITGVNFTITNSSLNRCSCEKCINYSAYECAFPINVTVYNQANININSLNITYTWGVDYCTDFNTHALNFSFRDNSNNSVNVNTQSNTQFYSDPSNVQNVSVSRSNVQNLSMCIYPSWSTIQAGILVQYGNVTGYTSFFEFSTLNTTLDNVTDFQTLRVIGGTSQVIFTVKDFDDTPIDGAFIKILLYDVGTNSYKLTESLKTDSNGQTIGNIILIDAFYKFIVEYQGIVRLIEPTTGGIRVLTTSKTFRINLFGGNWFDNYDIATNVYHSLTYDNATQKFTFTWSDPNSDMHQACLMVVQRNYSRSRQINETCIESPAGTIIQGIGQQSPGNDYIATGYLKFDDIHILDELLHRVAEYFSFKNIGDKQSGLYFSFILIAGLALVGVPFPFTSFALMILGLIGTAAIGMYAISGGLIAAIVILMLVHLYMGRRG